MLNDRKLKSLLRVLWSIAPLFAAFVYLLSMTPSAQAFGRHGNGCGGHEATGCTGATASGCQGHHARGVRFHKHKQSSCQGHTASGCQGFQASGCQGFTASGGSFVGSRKYSNRTVYYYSVPNSSNCNCGPNCACPTPGACGDPNCPGGVCPIPEKMPANKAAPAKPTKPAVLYRITERTVWRV